MPPAKRHEWRQAVIARCQGRSSSCVLPHLSAWARYGLPGLPTPSMPAKPRSGTRSRTAESGGAAGLSRRLPARDVRRPGAHPDRRAGGTRHALLWFECTGTEHRDVSGAATDAPSDTQVTEVLALDERTPRLFSYSDGVLEPEPGALHIDRSSIRLEAEAAAQGGFVKMVTTLNRSTGALRIVLITTINRLSSYTRQEHCVEVPAKLGK